MKLIKIGILSFGIISMGYVDAATVAMGRNADNALAKLLHARVVTPAVTDTSSIDASAKQTRQLNVESTLIDASALLISGMSATEVKTNPSIQAAKARGLPLILTNFNDAEMQALTGGFALLGQGSSYVALIRADVKGHYSNIEVYRPAQGGYVTQDWLEETAQQIQQAIDEAPFVEEKTRLSSSEGDDKLPIAAACARYEKDYAQHQAEGIKPTCYHWSASVKQGFDSNNAYKLLSPALFSNDYDHFSGNQGQSLSYTVDYYLIDGVTPYGAPVKYLVASLSGIDASVGSGLQVNTAHHRGLFLYQTSAEFSLYDSAVIDGKTYHSSPDVIKNVYTDRVEPQAKNNVDEVKTKMGVKVGMSGDKPSIGLEYSEERILIFPDFSVTHRRPNVHTDEFVYTLESTYDNIIGAKLASNGSRDKIIQCYAHTVYSAFPCDVNRLPDIATSAFLPAGEVVYRIDDKAQGQLIVGSQLKMTLLAGDGAATSKFTNGRTPQFVTKNYSVGTHAVIDVNAVG